MSVTTSTNTVSQSVLRLLADCEVHHSGELVDEDVVEGQNPRSPSRVDNPEWWPTDHRRVPQQRPINRNLDRELRPAGSFLVETCFILTMLGGVAVNAVRRPWCLQLLREPALNRSHPESCHDLAQHWRQNQ